MEYVSWLSLSFDLLYIVIEFVIFKREFTTYTISAYNVCDTHRD